MIIGLTGPARSGKDTAANLIEEILGESVKRVQIAGPLKAFCREVFDWTEEHTDGPLKDLPDFRYPRPCKECHTLGRVLEARGQIGCAVCYDSGISYLTPREAMQTLGDDWSTPLYPDIWALKAARTAKAYADEGAVAIVTDCRFIRDLQAVHTAGGMLIQLHRGDEGMIGVNSKHRSEIERTQPAFQALVNHHIYNHGTLDALKSALANILESC